MASSDFIADFISRWAKVTASERSTAQSFLNELCAVIEVPRPTATEDYQFERPVVFVQPNGKRTTKFMDLYRRGSFVLEAKKYDNQTVETPELALALETDTAKPDRKTKVTRGTESWDDAMLRAYGQAERYARHLPADEENPVFLVIVDVGHVIELYADFTQKGKTYVAYPDSRTHRVTLAELARPEKRELLRAVWLDPHSLDPTKRTTDVTLKVASHLAALAKSFETQKHPPKLVAEFLTRCLFCMFAEDVGLLAKDSFTSFLESMRGNPREFVPLMEALFREMDKGASLSTILRQKLLRFNGGLFAEQTVLPVDGTQLGLLIEASHCHWRDVEPAIFGTLLEQALTPHERGRLGAHFTPRAYVERLVLPVVIEPLRADFTAARDEAVHLANGGDLPAARARIRDFHQKLCAVRVLDPACGSGNFLYVTLEHMKRLEGDALDLLLTFGDTAPAAATVDPHQFLGLELNHRAVALAELVLWIGYLQWHFRIHGNVMPTEPVLRRFANIREADAVLAYDGQPVAVTGQMAAANPKLPGLPDHWRGLVVPHTDTIFVWDRRSMKTDPATGREIPDETKKVLLWAYRNPRPTEWPEADFIVGNPPFIGPGKLRADLGDGYAETLRSVYPDVPDSADFVMWWWHKAAELTRTGKVRRFGFITTNSLRQTFARRVVAHHLAAQPPLSLLFAIPDHPWVDPTEDDEKKAAVRIAMTVGAAGEHEGEVLTITDVKPGSDGTALILFSPQQGRIQSDLTVGANVTATVPLKANDGLTYRGVQLIGSGFIVTPDEARALGLGTTEDAERHIRPYRNGRDLTDAPRGVMVIDLFGLKAEEVRTRLPKIYERVLATVKPERDLNSRASYRENWWIHGEPRRDMRPALAGLPRYIATVETAKHRFFQFLDAAILPDNKLVVIALDDAFHLGVLGSRIHTTYALTAGSWLGFGNDPVYVKTRCFDPFPFPACTEKQKARIRGLAEELDAHRKRAQAQHGLGLTDIYNVLAKLRAGEALTTKDKAIHDAALVATLRQLHDDLDAAVAEAYGWPWPMSDAEILNRVVALNNARAAEEQAGHIRWLRPDYQAKGELLLAGGGAHIEPTKPAAKKTKPAGKQAWPGTIPAQIKAVEAAFMQAERPLTVADLAKQFSRVKEATAAQIVETLCSLGRLRPGDEPGTFVQ
ncbi:MAG: class I SAM-dependent DNA methyltransferase [Opitutaceae bacterium]|nr:class I SAM-dependent DNA methyltransferase [Opitutaceae bacterium]